MHLNLLGFVQVVRQFGQSPKSDSFHDILVMPFSSLCCTAFSGYLSIYCLPRFGDSIKIHVNYVEDDSREIMTAVDDNGGSASRRRGCIH